MENLLQRARYELKYIIQEPTAHEVRQYARNYLMPDPFASVARGYSYDIYSVYLDNPGLTLMNQTLEGMRNRFKLRVRFYDDHPDHPVFFEVKRRVNEAIVKVRAKVRRDRAHRLMYAHEAWPDHSDLASPGDERSFSALVSFCQLRDKLGARPECLVAYNREAWCAPEDDSIRVTFDRVLEAAPYDPDLTFGLVRNKDWVRPIMPVPGVVLELKFTDRFPNWMRGMVQTLNLFRTCMAKYVVCANSMSEYGLAVVRDVEAARQALEARRWEREQKELRERQAAHGQVIPGSGALPRAPLPPVPPTTLAGVPVGGRAM